MSRNAIVIVACLVFLGLHQDVWFWAEGETLLLGFLPVGLAYHAVYTIGVAGFWWWAVNFAWPKELDASDETHDIEVAKESPKRQDKDSNEW
ncbi:MAG: hypothetical protein M2R45_00495 [Verrucomicrobia subdivision 3 bacterium]|nr:hypothetical protein [Limisphaerales bacterium]MCS1413627.1 hypothetical protein [Limisphaerales bacterium]